MNKELTADLESILIDVCGRYRCEKIYKNCRYFMHIEIATEHIKQIIQSECKRFALECVPERIIKTNTVQTYFEDGHNICREQMIKNIEEKSK